VVGKEWQSKKGGCGKRGSVGKDGRGKRGSVGKGILKAVNHYLCFVLLELVALWYDGYLSNVG
jgi:hypothetical protein